MAAKTRQFRPSQTLFTEGDPAKSLFIIQKGSVAIRKRKEGGFIELAKIHSNEILGEISFFDRLPRSATAIAISEVEALEIEFAALDNIYQNTPTYLRTIFSCMSDRLRKANDAIRRLQRYIQSDPKSIKPEDAFNPEEINTSAVLAALAVNASTELPFESTSEDDEDK